MNVYDFDKTIFHFDSSYCFYCYCLRHRTRAVIKSVPAAIFQLPSYLVQGRQDAKSLKEALFSFANRIDNIDDLVLSFWECYENQVEAWYLQRMNCEDVIISASPQFLLQPIADRLGVRLIATKMNPYTGKIKGKNCHDQEKARRFLEMYPDAVVDEFYSDSLSDEPMARLANRAFLIQNEQCIPWPLR